MKERGNNLLKKIDRYCGIPLLALLRHSKLFRKQAKSGIPDNSCKVGIFCPGAIGDLLLASALLHGLRQKLPHGSMELLASPANAQAIPFLPYLDQSKVFPVTNPAKIIRYARMRKYDLFIDLSQWSRLGAIVAAFSGASLKAGFRTANQHRHYLYDIVVDHSCDRHECDNFLALGKAIWEDFTGQPFLNLPAPAQAMENVVCCHMWPAVGRNSTLKEWPESSWIELIALLKKTHRILLTGSHEAHAANMSFIERNFPYAENVEALYPDTLWKLASIFQSAKAVISVNTGVMHLAALAGAPTIGLHGPTSPARWGPLGRNSIALQPEKGNFGYLNLGFEYPANAQPCLQFLSVGQVLEAFKKLDSENGTHVERK